MSRRKLTENSAWTKHIYSVVLIGIYCIDLCIYLIVLSLIMSLIGIYFKGIKRKELGSPIYTVILTTLQQNIRVRIHHLERFLRIKTMRFMVIKTMWYMLSFQLTDKGGLHAPPYKPTAYGATGSPAVRCSRQVLPSVLLWPNHSIGLQGGDLTPQVPPPGRGKSCLYTKQGHNIPRNIGAPTMPWTY